MNEQMSLIDLVKKEMEKESALPVLSRKAQKLQDEVMHEDPDIQKIGAIIRTDPTLTSEVLKVANSPFYRGLEEVETLREAVLRLGQTEVVNIVMAVIHKANFKSGDPVIKQYQARLWHHSMACAFGTLWISKHLSMSELVPRAFIAGLLHDMGKLYLMTALEKIKYDEEIDFKPAGGMIGNILDKLHPVHGYSLLIKWHIPETYAVIARDHHADVYDKSDLLLLTVRLSNRVCNKLENPAKSGEDITGIVGSKEAETIGMTEISIAELEIYIEDAMKKFTV